MFHLMTIVHAEKGETMNLIDKDELVRDVDELSKDAGFYKPIYDGFKNCIKSKQTIDAVPVVRCKDCVHAVEIEKDYVRKLFVDGTKQCELGRADTVFGYSIISNDGFCDSGERKEDG